VPKLNLCRYATEERKDMLATFDDALARVSEEHALSAKQNKILNTEVGGLYKSNSFDP
jgi:hypothetical protein